MFFNQYRRRKREKIPPLAGYVEVVVAPDMRSLRRPKQTVHPARSKRTNATSVIQKPDDSEWSIVTR